MNGSENGSKARLSREDLKGGKMLRDAVAAFYAEQSEADLIEICVLLRDSYVWIPCRTVLSEADQSRMEELVKSAGDDLDQLVGKEIINTDPIRMIPDILQSDKGYFFPVFSAAEEMGGYGDGFSKVEVHFLEAISAAEGNELEITGIVLDPFTRQFVVPREMFGVVRKIGSRVED